MTTFQLIMTPILIVLSIAALWVIKSLTWDVIRQPGKNSALSREEQATTDLRLVSRNLKFGVIWFPILLLLAVATSFGYTPASASVARDLAGIVVFWGFCFLPIGLGCGWVGVSLKSLTLARIGLGLAYLPAIVSAGLLLLRFSG